MKKRVFFAVSAIVTCFTASEIHVLRRYRAFHGLYTAWTSLAGSASVDEGLHRQSLSLCSRNDLIPSVPPNKTPSYRSTLYTFFEGELGSVEGNDIWPLVSTPNTGTWNLIEGDTKGTALPSLGLAVISLSFWNSLLCRSSLRLKHYDPV